MKKRLALTALAAAAVLSLAACTAATADDDCLPQLKSGKYYLDGDKNSQAYICVENDTVYMDGEKLYDFFENDHRDFMPDVSDEKVIAENVNEFLELYTRPAKYSYMKAKELSTPEEPFYGLFFSRDPDGSQSAPTEILGSTYYRYDGKDTLILGVSSFVYAE